MNRTLESLALVAALFAASACAPDESTSTPIPLAPAGFDIPMSGHDGIRPAWETEGEKHQTKADGFDVRGNYQEIFGTTNAPSGGGRALAEFEPKDAVVIAWEGDLSPFMSDTVAAVIDAAPIYIVTPDLGYSNAVRQYLRDDGVDTSNIEFFEFQHESFWTRDYGPIPVALRDGSSGFVDPTYYPNRRRDDAIPTLMARHFGVPVYRPQLATEGGNFMTNGEGLCVVTEWLLEENPRTSRSEIERIKRDYYGCSRLVVLERMYGEGTGHVDMYAKFTSRDTVLVGEYDPRIDRQNAAILDRSAERLAALRLADGTPLRVVRIPMPKPTYPVYRSYTNSLIINNTVVVPTYRSDRDHEAAALAAYRRALPPMYKIVTIDSEAPIALGGAVHCTTMGFTFNGASPAVEPTPDPVPTPDEPDDVSTYTSTPRAAILDLKRTEDAIGVNATGTVGRVVIDVDIDHTYIGDLYVALEHDGKLAELQRFAGGNTSGLTRSFTVEGFAGLDRGGEWTLVIEDHYHQDEGVLNEWTLSFQ